MEKYLIRGYVIDGTGIRTPMQKALGGHFRSIATGGALQVVALSLDAIGRNSIPDSHMIRISVVGLDRDTKQYWTNPKNVPRSS